MPLCVYIKRKVLLFWYIITIIPRCQYMSFRACLPKKSVNHRLMTAQNHSLRCVPKTVDLPALMLQNMLLQVRLELTTPACL